MTTLKQLHEEGDRLYKESDVGKRIAAVESVAYVHGMGEYRGQIIQEFIHSERTKAWKAALEWANKNITAQDVKEGKIRDRLYEGLQK